MAIGYESSYYTLVEANTGVVHKFNAGTIAVINNEYIVQKQGDDFVLTLKDVVPNTSGGYTVFNINGLVGAHMRMTRISAGYAAFRVTFYEGSYSASSVTNRVFQFDNVRGDDVPWSSFGMLKKGMFICFMPNAEYEGSYVLPATFPCVNSGNIAVKSPVVGYPMKYSNVAAYTYDGAKIPSLWYTGNVIPATRLLKIYPTLGYSDSGDVSKQGLLVVKGFPYGQDNKYVSVSGDSGHGEMQDTSTPIAVDVAPLLLGTAFFNVWKMNYTDLSELRNLLVSEDFISHIVDKLFNNAMDYIVGLHALPFSASNTVTKEIWLANLDTNIMADSVQTLYEDIDMGSVEIPEYFGTFMDMHPYTKISLYLPFCSTVELVSDYFVGDVVKVKYRVDIVTGQCIAFVSNSKGLITTATGNCSIQFPIRANDYSRCVSGFVGVAGSAAALAWGLSTGNVSAIAGGGAAFVGSVVNEGIAMNKPAVLSNGSYAGNTGALGNRKPYLIIQRPTISFPENYSKTVGYQSLYAAKLGDLTGFTVVSYIHLEHIVATEQEKAELEALLKKGVIL